MPCKWRRWALCWDLSVCPASWFLWWSLGIQKLFPSWRHLTWGAGGFFIMFVIPRVLAPSRAPGGSFPPCTIPGQPSHLPSLHVLAMWCREDPHINRQGLLFVVTISAYKSLQALPASSPIPCCTTHSSLFLWQGMYFILWGSHQHSLYRSVRV